MVSDTNNFPDVFVHDRLTGETHIVSLAHDGSPADGTSDKVRLAEGGRFVFFESLATNLVPGDTNGESDVFVRDRDPDGDGIFDPANARTVRLSVDSQGNQASGRSLFPSPSADGRFVAFESNAPDLVTGDTNAQSDVFLRDRDPDGNGVFDEPGALTTRESLDSAGQELAVGSFGAVPTHDASAIAFSTVAGNLVAGDNNGLFDGFVRDRASGSVTRVTQGDVGQDGNASSFACCFARGQRLVLFITSSSNLVPGDTNGDVDVFLRDRDPDGNGVLDEGNGTTERVSLSVSGEQADGRCWIPSVSSDGRWALFQGPATNLVEGDTNGITDIFLRDLSRLELVGTPRHPEAVRVRLRRAFGDEGKDVLVFASCRDFTPPTRLPGGPLLPLRFDAWTRWALQRPELASAPIGPDGAGTTRPLRFPPLTPGSQLYLAAGLRAPGSTTFDGATGATVIDVQ